MSAELIAVGSELLRFGRHDGNGAWLAERLQRLGVDVVRRTLVGDDAPRIAEAVSTAAAASRWLVITGGLGPTEDDRTREGLARALGRPLERDATRAALLRAAFEARGRSFAPEQERQAERPAGAEWLDNDLGTAPGIVCQLGSCTVFALPGVPAEMRRMFDLAVAPRVAADRGGGLARRVLRIGGRYEASVDAQVRELYGAPGVEVTILAAREGIELHLLTAGDDQRHALERLETLERRLLERLGHDVWGRDDDSLPGVVGALLSAAGATLATAESCTAGALAAAITAVPGSSGWFRGGLVVYADDLKTRLAGVPAALIERYGAVSEEVARALAEGARTRCGASHGIGVTGIAGPGGGTPDKPVGRVHVALAGPGETGHWRTDHVGDRDLIRARTVAFALDRLRRRLLEGAGPAVRR